MCKILLSINPEYSYQILQGTKKYEYRRQIAKRTVDEILIYSTAPDMKVIGSVKVHSVIKEHRRNFGKKQKNTPGYAEKNFFHILREKKPHLHINWEMFRHLPLQEI